MNDQLTDKPNVTRRLTDAALVIVALAAVTTWLWRRFRTRADAQDVIMPLPDSEKPAEEEATTSASSANGSQV